MDATWSLRANFRRLPALRCRRTGGNKPRRGLRCPCAGCGLGFFLFVDRNRSALNASSVFAGTPWVTQCAGKLFTCHSQNEDMQAGFHTLQLLAWIKDYAEK